MTRPLTRCLLILGDLHGLPASTYAVTAGLPLEGGRLLPSQFERAARRIGLRSTIVDRELDQLTALQLPAVLLLRDETLQLARAAFQATSAQLPLLEQQVTAAIATRDAYAKQFNIGQRTLLDVLNAENEVTQARQSVVTTLADNLLARYRLLEAMGILVDELGVGEVLVQN